MKASRWRHDSSRASPTIWVGYSYQWNQAQKEATLTPADERIATTLQTGEGSVQEIIPARQDCIACHNAEAGAFSASKLRSSI